MMPSARMLGTAVLGSLLIVGCQSSPNRVTIVHEGPGGAVYLEQVSDTAFQATHPAALHPSLLARVLNGVRVQDEGNLVGKVLLRQAKEPRAFSTEDTAFLAPLLARGLSQASPDQRIGFRIIQMSTAGAEMTGGTLYAFGRSLHLTLTQYRRPWGRAGLSFTRHEREPDSTGLQDRSVLFVPEVALRPGIYDQTEVTGARPQTALVIDYALLESLPSEEGEVFVRPAADEGSLSPTPGTGGVSAEGGPGQSRTQGTRDQDAELEGLRKQMRSLERRLTEQESEIQDMKRRSKPSSDAGPSRP